MSTLAFLSGMGISKLGKLGNAITTAIVQFDPETASQVQIDQMSAHCEQLAGRVAQAEQEDERLHTTMTALEKTLADTTRAATILGAKLQANPSDHTVEMQLNTLLATMEKIGGPEGDGTTAGTLFEARQDHAQAEADLHEWQTVHAGAVEALTSARQTLARAQHDMERSAMVAQREHERQEQAKRDAGLKSGLDTGNIALSAMQKAAEDARQRARAAQLNTEAIKTSTGVGAGSANDIVAQTLASATAQPSALDRLARMTKSA